MNFHTNTHYGVVLYPFILNVQTLSLTCFSHKISLCANLIVCMLIHWQLLAVCIYRADRIPYCTGTVMVTTLTDSMKKHYKANSTYTLNYTDLRINLLGL